LTKVVNALTAKIEIGGPMASLYLLKYPDHYTGHKFKTFYWKNYVKVVRSAWETEDNNIDKETDKVVIGKKDGEYVAISSVDDYIHRPDKYESMSLYNWIRLATKYKLRRKHNSLVNNEDHNIDTDEDDNIKFQFQIPVNHDNMNNFKSGRTKKMTQAMKNSVEYEKYAHNAYLEGNSWAGSSDDGKSDVDEPNTNQLFKPDHRQADTHAVHMSEDDNSIVPNFVGGSLPRCDQGDREYYCCTMLTLFKPWRNGKDLKFETQTWDESFLKYEFSKRQLEILKYFNIRYECLDARDDYSSKRKNEQDQGIFPQWTLQDLPDDFDENLLHTGDDFELNNEDFDSEYDQIGKEGDKIIQQMLEMDNIIKNSGWMNESVDGLPSVDLSPVQPEVLQAASKWEAAVQAKRQQYIDEKNRNMPNHPKLLEKTQENGYHNEVKIINKDYLQRDFKHIEKSAQDVIDKTVADFNLNSEQERAFRIVANHATTPNAERLSMYLGGMGGTGKSRVIEALVNFFSTRNEEHRFMILAPTGSAAALLNGSTYHSALGINDRSTSAKNVAQVRSRIEGVDYIFLDEVSMLSCHDIFKISAQLAKAANEYEQPFGGINMIFAGDFAQLKPVKGAALYSGHIGTELQSRMNNKKQEETIGKALWHQITTVVILRENMRQRSQSVEDAQLWTALENMRYKACTPSDIQFLRTRIAGDQPDKPKLAQKRFRNVSIITAWNAHKDQINKLGSERFANETGQTLTTFYSKDQWAEETEIAKQNKWTKQKRKNHKRDTNTLSPSLQKALWNLPHGSTEHIPGKLSICIGMPVMLRHNEATECCITKGAEGTVAGWQASMGSHGKPMLDTLFVKLSNPPKTVHIEGLPPNVVPITRHSTKTICRLWNDQVITVSRNQVLVLPNFAMTDYAAQGRTRPDNVVELNNCRDHQSYYTCLSRSATAEGTIILQGFDSTKITGGAHGTLRQEFRELEILDLICKLRYEGTLPNHIDGHRRNTLIRQFQSWQGPSYVPQQVHPAIRWSISNPLLVNETQDVKWFIPKGFNKNTTAKHKDKDNTQYTAAKGSIPLYQTNESPINKKHKLDFNDVLSNKKQKLHHGSESINNKYNIEYHESILSKKVKLTDTSHDRRFTDEPQGLIWDGQNYSCAYDSFFSIIWNIWREDPAKWTQHFSMMSVKMNELAQGFASVEEKVLTIEELRNNVRQGLHQDFPGLFPYGHRGASVVELAEKLFHIEVPNVMKQQLCDTCDFIGEPEDDHLSLVIHGVPRVSATTREQLRTTLVTDSRELCAECLNPLKVVLKFHHMPEVLLFSVSDNEISMSRTIKVRATDRINKYYLKGIIYHGGFHFTARIIQQDNTVWFHDGQLGRYCHMERAIKEFNKDDLNYCGDRRACLAIYIQN
jgi:hypothetical protein